MAKNHPALAWLVEMRRKREKALAATMLLWRRWIWVRIKYLTKFYYSL
jgi:hypothetical protein